MKLLDSEKWALIRSKGKRPFIRSIAFRIGFSLAFVMSLVYVWASYRLYSVGVFTARQAIAATAVTSIALFSLSPIIFWVCAELSWRLSEHLYHRREASAQNE